MVVSRVSFPKWSEFCEQEELVKAWLAPGAQQEDLEVKREMFSKAETFGFSVLPLQLSKGNGLDEEHGEEFTHSLCRAPSLEMGSRTRCIHM